jgi:predicted type IV restriction endonuclease
MSTLSQVLPQVRDRIARYRGTTIGEQDTRAVLIEPVLRALGWHVEDLRRSSANTA